MNVLFSYIPYSMDILTDHILALIFEMIDCDIKQYFDLARVCKRFKKTIYQVKKTRILLMYGRQRIETIRVQISKQLQQLATERKNIEELSNRINNVVKGLNEKNKMYKISKEDLQISLNNNACIIKVYGDELTDPYQAFVNEQILKAKKKKCSPPSDTSLKRKWLSMAPEIKQKQYVIPCSRELNSKVLRILGNCQQMEVKAKKDIKLYDNLSIQAAMYEERKQVIESHLMALTPS